MVRSLIVIGVVGAALSCNGTTQIGGPPDGGDVAVAPQDLAMTPDTREPDLGPQPDPLCVGVTCTPNAVCGRGTCWCAPGFMGDPAVGCTPGDPCADQMCTFGATCTDAGACVCDIGFEANTTRCDAVANDFPLDRTVEEVCARWTAEYPETAGVRYQTAPADQCDPGALDPTYQLDAVRRVSLYRWLVGLRAVTTTADYAKWSQACATTLDAHNMGATNTIGPEFTCYSANAAQGALNSSVLRGASSAAAAVDTFVEDAAAAALGNRRWIMNPGMGATAFGSRGDYTCMYAIDGNGSSTPPYFAYPLGVFPAAALRGRWMWGSSSLFANDTTTVTVMDSAGGNVEVTNVTPLRGNIFPGVVAWEVAPTPPGEYTVTLQGLAGAMNELTYPVNLVTCP